MHRFEIRIDTEVDARVARRVAAVLAAAACDELDDDDHRTLVEAVHVHRSGPTEMLAARWAGPDDVALAD